MQHSASKKHWVKHEHLVGKKEKDNKNDDFLLHFLFFSVFSTESVNGIQHFSVWNFKEIIFSPLGYFRSSSGYKIQDLHQNGSETSLCLSRLLNSQNMMLRLCWPGPPNTQLVTHHIDVEIDCTSGSNSHSWLHLCTAGGISSLLISLLRHTHY